PEIYTLSLHDALPIFGRIPGLRDPMSDVTVRQLNGLSNLEFLKKYAKPGCVGLLGGSSAIDRAIRTGQRGLDGASKPSLWSHAVLFQGERIDGQHWLIESDFDVGQGSV